jgi:hypothetical protein
MLRILLAKDLRRARRNPLPWLIFLLVPLCTVALIGVVFGGGGKKDQMLGRVRLGLVDEDNSMVTRILRGAGQQGEAAKNLETVVLDRAAALAQLNDNKLSAVLILPKGLTDDYLHGRPTKLELIKNPAESIKPTLIEEGAGIVVTGLSGLSRNFSAQFGAIETDFKGERDFRAWSNLLKRIDDNLARYQEAGRPALVWYAKPPDSAAATTKPASGGVGFSLFGYLLLGMAAMFLLFLGGVGIGDLHKEVELRTLQRFQTIRDSLAPFLIAKVLFAAVMLLGCAALLFGGGALVFGVAWKHPLELGGLVLAYALFITGLMALIVAWLPDQRKADALRTMTGMALGLAGGCAMPLDMAPQFYRERIMPLLPTHWFVSTARALEFGGDAVVWPVTALKLALVGALCLALAAWLFRRRFLQGGRV